METYNVEMTDTFGGEANYSWVKRREIMIEEPKVGESIKQHERRIVKAAKAALGITGERCQKESVGEA